MKYLLALILTVFVCASARAQLIDNFNEYTSGSYIQVQSNPGGSSGLAGTWSRLGTATSDGIYSIAGGEEGRGATYDTNYSGGSTGFVKFTFAAAQNFTATPELQSYLDVGTSLSGTTVNAQITDGNTTFALTTPLALTNTTYQQFSFDFTSTDTTLSSGSESLSTVLSNTTAVLLQFKNTSGSGSQAINFDDVQMVTDGAPEPSARDLMILSLGFCGMIWRLRKICG
jgi:hypothetical protein